MRRRKIWFYSTLLVTVSTIVLLVTGSPLLELALDNKDSIPAGTLITWAGMVSLPLTIYWGVKELRKPTTRLNKILAGFHKIIITLGIFWVPISYLLAEILLSSTNLVKIGKLEHNKRILIDP